jgi:hypothetical protein
VATSGVVAGLGVGPDLRAAADAAHRDPGGLEIGAGRLPANDGGFLDAAERPASRPSARTCCCLWSLKTLLMSGEGPSGHRRRQRLGTLSVVAGFQPSISGRFWVSTEVEGTHLYLRITA